MTEAGPAFRVVRGSPDAAETAAVAAVLLALLAAPPGPAPARAGPAAAPWARRPAWHGSSRVPPSWRAGPRP
jgi:Acyl-CoA carboxylase epsilon subunit